MARLGVPGPPYSIAARTGAATILAPVFYPSTVFHAVPLPIAFGDREENYFSNSALASAYSVISFAT